MKKQLLQTGRGFFLGATLVFAALLLACAPPRGTYHRVERGQTFYRICKTYQVDEDAVARINRIRDRAALRVGQRLFIPGVDGTRYVPSTAAGGKTLSRSKPVRSKPGAAAAAPVNKRPAPESSRPLPSDAKGKFSWPVSGPVVRQFGRTESAVSKGVEIAVPSGTDVRAAAAGKVTYSGNGITGYGNLIILKHDESYFTVYGFNQKALVRTGEYVSKAQRIALSGTPPGGGKPRIHFEVRRGKEALNPLYFLP